MRKVPVKNYLFLFLIVLFTVGLVFYLRSWYNTSKEFYEQNSVITQVVREIKCEEIENYALENQKFILYVSSGKDSSIKDFENDFRDLIKKLDLGEDILYMNLDYADVDFFYDIMKNKFTDDSEIIKQLDLDSSPSIFMFTDGKVSTVLNNVNNYTINIIENIIKRWDNNA